MAMNICVFEDASFNQFYPLTYLRPVYMLRAGILPLFKRPEHYFEHVDICLAARSQVTPLLAEMESDAYATATALYALLATEQLSPGDTASQHGIEFLLQSQEDDGSWHVVTRAEGFQTYFESGFPHGDDQFLSIAASSWATLALLQALP